MAARPILFSGPMVRAILDGRKTMTRRVLKPGRSPSLVDGSWSDDYVLDPGNADWLARDVRFAPGDLLWVRESLGRRTSSFLGIEATNGTEEALYLADGEDVTEEKGFNVCPWWAGKSLPSIQMPRWASRLTLAVTAVKVERLQDISEAQALAEGIYRVDPTPEEIASGDADADCFVFKAPGTRQGWGLTKSDRANEQWHCTARDAFGLLWNSINGPGAWEANPWVAAVSFTVHRANVDALPAEPA